MMKLPYEQNRKTVIDFFEGNFGREKLDELMDNAAVDGHRFITREDFDTWLAHSAFDAIHDFFEEYDVDVQ